MLSHFYRFSWSQNRFPHCFFFATFQTFSEDDDFLSTLSYCICVCIWHSNEKNMFFKRNELSTEKDMQFSFWTTSYSDRKDPMFQTFVEELFKRRAIHILATLNLNRGRNIHCSRAISIQYTNHIHKKNIMKKWSWENNGLIALVLN